ncbi:hypothetical protein H5410_032013 [Solanum commersonii]|uniref:Uncharacterized protein n=1 Tax=Solanum commersonii TaxID=4109 RepID=A0A9J5YIS5_SOLCO|nr:hypothetical protein H5410_032013 [Solanum commersonii]
MTIIKMGKLPHLDSEYVSTTGEESTGAAFFFFAAPSFKHSASILRISVEDVGINSTSFFRSLGTRARLHISVINTGKGREVWRYLDLMAISCPTIIPKLIHCRAMIAPRQAVFEWRRTDSFWDGITILLIKPNQYLAATYKSLFSIWNPASNHLGVP